MNVTYRDWNLYYGEPMDEPSYDEHEAQRRFETGESLWVLVGDPTRPAQVISVDLGGRLVEVSWLDSLLRPELQYVFTQPDGINDDRLLLAITTIRRWDETTPLPEAEETYAETYYFNLDGTFHGTRGGPIGSVSEQTEGVLDAERLALQTEPRPAFGDWTSVSRLER